jgi:anthranilate phosphoribosyltransferase
LGKKDAFYEIVLLNTAFALSLTKTDIFDLDIIKENYLIAKHTIDSGKALKTINNMIDFTQSY